jgi:hypothetical protein
MDYSYDDEDPILEFDHQMYRFQVTLTKKKPINKQLSILSTYLTSTTNIKFKKPNIFFFMHDPFKK